MKYKWLTSFILFLLLVNLNGCVNIKSTTPKINVFQLKQSELPKFDDNRINKSIFIKNFSIKTELSSEKIVIIEDDINVVKCNYHLWNVPLDEMLTDFAIDRMSKYKIFTKGVVSSTTMLPDIVLECRIIDCSINNYIEKKTANSVGLSIAANVYAAKKGEPEFVTIFSEVYTKNLLRPDNTISSAIDVMSECASEIIDDITKDIQKHIDNKS